VKTKTCKQCTKPIFGRADKLFCDNQCRNEFNNKRYGKTNNFVRKVNRIIKNNRNILEQLTATKKLVKVKRNILLNHGFCFEYFTNTCTKEKESVYYFCYDFGYLPLENDYFALVNRKEISEE
jgi:hypothetical protein